MTTTYAEYTKAKKAFFAKHKGMKDVYTSTMENDSYHKIYTAMDGKLWYESMFPNWEPVTVHVYDNCGHMIANTREYRKMLVVEFWNDDGLNSKYLEQY